MIFLLVNICPALALHWDCLFCQFLCSFMLILLMFHMIEDQIINPAWNYCLNLFSFFPVSFSYLNIQVPISWPQNEVSIIWPLLFSGDTEADDDVPPRGLSKSERSHLIVWQVPFIRTKKLSTLSKSFSSWTKKYINKQRNMIN